MTVEMESRNQKRLMAYYSRIKEMAGKSKRDAGQWDSYTIMHGNQEVVSICRNGDCKVYSRKWMPYNLYLEPVIEDNIDTRIQNLDNFYHWCASRVLTLDRKYAKEILNSIGATQASTDRDRAHIALSYHCLSLMDIYWTKESDEKLDFEDLNLFDNHLEKAFVDVTLRGKQLTIENRHLIADDLATLGCYPKAWIRKEDGFWLMKDGNPAVVEDELLASKICRCFQVRQVLYEEGYYDGQKVSISKIITSSDVSIVSMESFEIYAMNHDINKMEYILELDGYSYYMMNILDYLIGNTDRHWGNWGLLIDNKTNEPIRLYDLMDFNQSFGAYDTIEGANCLTVSKKQTQKEAALEAVAYIGLNQICEIPPEWFVDTARGKMFYERLELLQKHAGSSVQ